MALTLSPVVYGSHLIMSDSMIDHVIAFAQAKKLRSVQHLINETGWQHNLASQYGESLLAIIHKCYDNAVPSTCVTTQVMHCSTCGQLGHNCKKFFLYYLRFTYTTFH